MTNINSRRFKILSKMLHIVYKRYTIFLKFSVLVNHFYYPTNVLNYTKLRG